MDELPPELLLKIAGYCDFAEICAISMVNKRCYELIDSNWNSLKKAEAKCTVIEEDGIKDVKFERYFPGFQRKMLEFQVLKGSENVYPSEILKNGWTKSASFGENAGQEQMVVRPKDVDEFLEDLFTSIFRRSNFSFLALRCLKSPTLQLIISLLERSRPKVETLSMSVGSNSSVNIQELADSARIVELSNPQRLRFVVPEYFAKEEFREHFLQRIAKLDVDEVDMSCADFDGDPNSMPKQGMRGPLPNCQYMYCTGHGAVSALAVPDFVDLVEEWSNNKRDVGMYNLYNFVDDIEDVAAQFRQALKERNLPIKLEVVRENFEFKIEKAAGPGDTEVVLHLTFEEPEFADEEGNYVRILSYRRR